MNLNGEYFRRTDFLVAGSSAALALGLTGAFAATGPFLMRPFSRHSDAVPAIDTGSWITSNVDSNERLRDTHEDVFCMFFGSEGILIDSSSMYGPSHVIIGLGIYGADMLATFAVIVVASGYILVRSIV